MVDYIPDTDIINMAILPSSEVGGKTEALYIDVTNAFRVDSCYLS